MPKKIRVAFWHNVFAPYRVPLFQKLASFDDIELTVYYGSTKDSYRNWTVDFNSGYTHVLLPHISIPFYPYNLNYTLLTELLRKNADVYIAVENEIGGQIAYVAARLKGKPFLLWSVEIAYHIIRDKKEYTLPGCVKKVVPFIGRQLQRIVFFPLQYGAGYIKRHADGYLAAGRHTEKHLIAAGAQHSIFRYGNTVDTVRLHRQLQEQHESTLKHSLGIEGKHLLLSISYLQKRKGIQYLIEAFLQMNRQDTVLLIVGDGEYRQDLLKRIPENCPNILFIGHDEDTAKYYAIADIFVMPSFSDPWGLTVNEAMVAGLPVITTTNVGAQELIQGNGFVIPPRDSRILQVTLEKLLNDAQLRKEMGERSREIIQHYTIAHSAEVCRAAIYAVTKR